MIINLKTKEAEWLIDTKNIAFVYRTERHISVVLKAPNNYGITISKSSLVGDSTINELFNAIDISMNKDS